MVILIKRKCCAPCCINVITYTQYKTNTQNTYHRMTISYDMEKEC